MKRPVSLGLALATLFCPLLAPLASANQRHFTYTYESAVLPQGAREIEVWATPRFGRDTFYSRFDQRLEFEVGLTDRLQTSLYLNYTGLTAETMPGIRASSFTFGGVSSEWKYKVSDPVADGIGMALYGELSVAPTEIELETKLIFDKRWGKVLVAGNLVGEFALESEPGKTEPEGVVEADLAGTYFLSPGVSLGLELRNHNMIIEEEFHGSVLFAGPVLAYAAASWWVALSVMPQLTALKKTDGARGRLELTEHEKINARLLFSFAL